MQKTIDEKSVNIVKTLKGFYMMHMLMVIKS